MIKEIFEYLVNNGETQLGVSVLKGFPDWARPNMTLPIAAVELAASSPGTYNRTGHPQAQRTLYFRFFIFARHEPELCEKLESLVNWLAGLGRREIEGQFVAFRQQDGQRHEPATNAQQEMHGFWISIQVTW